MSGSRPAVEIVAAKRRPLTREAVIAAARDMVSEMGHEAFSLRPLAARLSVTASALYMFANDRQGLLEAVVEAEYTRHLKNYQAISASVSDPIQRLREISRVYVADARETPELFKLRLRYSPVIGEDAAESTFAAGRQAFDLAKAAVEEAMSLGFIRSGNGFALSMLIWAAVHGVASFVLMGAERHPGVGDDLVDDVLDALIVGLSPEVGRNSEVENPITKRSVDLGLLGRST